MSYFATRLGRPVTTQDFIAYIAATAAHSAFTSRFQEDLSTPGLRIPITADASIFDEAVAVGHTVIWLHTFGERMANPDEGRQSQPPRLPEQRRPRIPVTGAIPQDSENMPDEIDYEPVTKRLRVGSGFVENVEEAVWRYEVSGKQVLLQWFSYRKKNRERPIIGDRRPPSMLGAIHPGHWIAEYTTELINVLNVLGWLVEMEPRQAALLDQICAGPLISLAELQAAGALEVPPKRKLSRRARSRKGTPDLFDL